MKSITIALIILTSVISGILLRIWFENPRNMLLGQCPPCPCANLLGIKSHLDTIISKTKQLADKTLETSSNSGIRDIMVGILKEIDMRKESASNCFDTSLNDEQKQQVINIFKSNIPLNTKDIKFSDIIGIINQYESNVVFKNTLRECRVTQLLYLTAFVCLFSSVRSVVILDTGSLLLCSKTISDTQWKNFFEERMNNSRLVSLPGCMRGFANNLVFVN